MAADLQDLVSTHYEAVLPLQQATVYQRKPLNRGLPAPPPITIESPSGQIPGKLVRKTVHLDEMAGTVAAQAYLAGDGAVIARLHVPRKAGRHQPAVDLHDIRFMLHKGPGSDLPIVLYDRLSFAGSTEYLFHVWLRT